MESEIVSVKLRKIWHNIAKQHLNCMYTTYKLCMSLLWRLKICILTKWPKIRVEKIANKKQFLGPIFPDLLNNFGAISNFWQFIKTVYCKVHSEITFAKLKKEELLVQTNWGKRMSEFQKSVAIITW